MATASNIVLEVINKQKIQPSSWLTFSPTRACPDNLVLLDSNANLNGCRHLSRNSYATSVGASVCATNISERKKCVGTPFEWCPDRIFICCACIQHCSNFYENLIWFLGPVLDFNILSCMHNWDFFLKMS